MNDLDQKKKSEIGAQAAIDANSALIKELEKRKGGLNKAALRLVQAMDAKKTVTATFEGQITDTLDMIDHSTRLQAAKYVVQIHNAEPAQRSEISGPGGGPIQTEDKSIKDRVLKYFEDLKQKDGDNNG